MNKKEIKNRKLTIEEKYKTINKYIKSYNYYKST